MIRLWFYLTLVCLDFLLFSPVKAINSNSPLAGLSTEPLTINDTITFNLQNKKTSQIYKIFASIPKEPPPEDGYPIIYITDANSIFDTVRETIRSYEKRPDNIHKNHAVLVGIGYPPDQNILKLRTYDLTPPQNTLIPILYKTGGADYFYHFIQDDLKPLLDKHLKINHHKQAIFGHSFGGLFTIYNLIYHPDSYQIYIAASPSLWLDPSIIDKHTQSFKSSLDVHKLHPTLSLSVGEYEQKFPDYWQSIPQVAKIKQQLLRKQQVSRILAACETFKKIDDLSTTCTKFENEDHQSVIPASIGRAVAIIFRSFAQ